MSMSKTIHRPLADALPDRVQHAVPVSIEVIEGHDRVADLAAEFNTPGMKELPRVPTWKLRAIQQTFLRGAGEGGGGVVARDGIGVGVRIEMQHREVRMAPRDAQCGSVTAIAAHRNGNGARVQDRADAGLD